MPIKSVSEVLRRAEEVLETARLGLEDLLGPDPRKRLSGIYNVAVFGRSTTLALQNLRSAVDDREHFETWYAGHVERMNSDPLFRYFVELRNEILKEGPPRTSVSFSTRNLTINPEEARRSAPPGAETMFIGDRRGGSGYKIRMPDGTLERYYTDLPGGMSAEISPMQLHLPNPPVQASGEPFEDSSIQALSSLYIDELGRIVADARQTFD